VLRSHVDQAYNCKMLENDRPRGKLKLFLGYADGVGKTHAMLEAARQRKQEGLDVVAVEIDSQNQPDSERLLAEFEIIPYRRIDDGNATRDEVDLDAIQKRNPGLVLIDNLAQQNQAKARHPKRYQDVEDLLDSGINVYSTLNIQHLESLRDVVFQITGVKIQDTVPDSVFDEANIIELVDLPPDELLKRYQEGKIIIPPSLAMDADKFFRLGNLIALRELSMRRAAGRIENQMLAYMTDREIPGPWPASEKLMVCLGSHPLDDQLIRAGQRLAKELNAGWLTVYVETPESLGFSQRKYNRVISSLRLAEELGAKVVKITGRTVPETIVDYALKQNVTKIIIGKPIQPRWIELIRGSVVNEVIRRSGNIGVYVLSDQDIPQTQSIMESWRPHGKGIRYLYAVLVVAAATILGLPLNGLIHPTNMVMIYLAAVVLAAAYFGRGPSMLASFLSILAFDYFFIHPQFSLDVTDTQYLITFFGLLVVSMVISNLAGLVRDQVISLRDREIQTSTLYSLSRELTVLVDIQAILNTIIQQIAETFSRESVILLPRDGRLVIQAASEGLTLDGDEKTAAEWAFEHGQPAGRGTNTLQQAGLRCQPLRSPRGLVGVLGVKPTDPGVFLSPDQTQFLDAYSSLAALAIERVSLAEEASRAQIITAKEKLQTALLNSISHDLRTPLATITGVLSSLFEAEQTNKPDVQLEKADRVDLIETAWGESRRLNRLVGNLLDMTRVESGALKLNCQSGDLQDLIGAALRRLTDLHIDHPLHANLPQDLPPVMMDFVLMEQVLVNLLDNADKYSKPGQPIEIDARLLENKVEISISDLGVGIPTEDLERVFEKFYRVQRKDGAQGTGLGLSICKGIVEAHGGQIWAENRPGGGTTMRFTLNVEDNLE
jgi:two-component system, OmpR family, sensor histidine kinase KdpD